MVIKIITLLFGSLSKEQKKQVIVILEKLVKAGAEGAVAGAIKK